MSLGIPLEINYFSLFICKNSEKTLGIKRLKHCAGNSHCKMADYKNRVSVVNTHFFLLSLDSLVKHDKHFYKHKTLHGISLNHHAFIPPLNPPL